VSVLAFSLKPSFKKGGPECAKGGCMNFAEILIGISVCTAIFGTYCATRVVAFPNWNSGGSESPRLHFVTRREFASLAKSTHDQVLFQLQSSQLKQKHAKSSLQGIGITVEELAKCIAWIPGDSSIFVSSTDGFSPSLLRKLKRLRTRRDLFLIRELPENLGSIEKVEARVL
jgi:hypothetical protein